MTNNDEQDLNDFIEKSRQQTWEQLSAELSITNCLGKYMQQRKRRQRRTLLIVCSLLCIIAAGLTTTISSNKDQFNGQNKIAGGNFLQLDPAHNLSAFLLNPISDSASRQSSKNFNPVNKPGDQPKQQNHLAVKVRKTIDTILVQMISKAPDSIPGLQRVSYNSNPKTNTAANTRFVYENNIWDVLQRGVDRAYLKKMQLPKDSATNKTLPRSRPAERNAPF